jgi:sarcosine oxidase subunit beta
MTATSWGDCSFRQVGVLILIDESNATPGRHVLESQRKHGVEVREVSPQDIAELAPHFDLEGVVTGVYETRSGYADPVRTTHSLVQRAKDWGLVAYEGVGATGIQLRGDRVTGVETEQGPIETRVVINAAGPWGRHVGLWVGRNYSIRWSREAEMALRLPSDFGPFPVTSDPGLRVYFRPQDDDKVVAGLGSPKDVEPLDIDGYDEKLDPASRQRIERPLFQRVSSLRYAGYVYGWASIYTITDDWHPLVGSEPDLEGYYACFAGSGHCFKLGPPIGEALADVISGDTPTIDISAFRPDRFIDGEHLTSAWGGGNRA